MSKECPCCGCKDGNHAQECEVYYNAGYGKRISNTEKDNDFEKWQDQIINEISTAFGIPQKYFTRGDK